MAFLTTSAIGNEALRILRSNIVTPGITNRSYEVEFRGNERRGDTVKIRRRRKGVNEAYNGSTVDKKAIDESSIDLTLSEHRDSTIKVGSKDMTLSIQDFGAQVLEPEMASLGETFDSFINGLFLDIPNVAGPSESAPAALPDSLADLAQVEKTLNDQLVPMRPRFKVASSEYKSVLMGVDSLVEADKRGDAGTALRDAEMGRIMSMQSFMAQNVPTATHTSGTLTTAVVNGAVAEGSTTITVDGANEAAGTLKAGDIVTIGGYGNAVIAADATLSSNAGSFTIVEPVRVGGIDDNASVTLYDGGGNTRQNHGAVFHPDCIAWAMVPLALPSGARDASIVTDPSTGIGLRVVFDYDMDLKSDVISIDTLYGGVVADGRLGAQIAKNIA